MSEPFEKEYVSPPQTLDEALKRELSQSTRRALELAGAMAEAEGGTDSIPVIGLRALIGGMLRVGFDERGTGLIAGVLAEKIEELVPADRVKLNLAPEAGRGGSDTVLSPLAIEAMNCAASLAEQTVARTRIDARHLIVALIGRQPGLHRLGAALERIWLRDWDTAPRELYPFVLDAIEHDPEPEESLAVWRTMLGTRVLEATAFNPDMPGTVDALDRRDEARRMAELACLRDNPPPLAIGLFGDWGSGKSSFMAMMAEEVERIGKQWRPPAPGSAADKADCERHAERVRTAPFVLNVAQIRFNAWSFSDSNLWASLAVEIFGGLRAEVERIETDSGKSDPKRNRSRKDALFQEIFGKLTTTLEKVEGAEQRQAQAAEQESAAEAEVTRLEQQLEVKDEQNARELLKRYPDAVTRLIDAVAPGTPSADAARLLAEEVRKVREAGSETLAIGRRFVTVFRQQSTWSVIVPLLGLTLAVALMAWLGPAGSGAGVLAALVTAVASWARGAKLAAEALRPLLEQVEQRNDDIERLQIELDAARKAVIDARWDTAARAQEKAGHEARAAELDRALSSPGGMLRYFLNESEELRHYENEIGLIGRLRRSFERLDSLMAKQAALPAGRDPALPVIDRIVLYIDDLDRLREEQVVKVLEAVALLLQFRLFVVVVAVDERWLRGALQTHYGRQFENGAGPSDYLEKIFQVPFWLQRLGGDAKAYESLARALLPETPSSPADVEPEVPEKRERFEDGFARLAQGELELDPEEVPRSGDDEAPESRADTAKRVLLSGPEATLLGALMPLAADTPRAAKRFVNLYRLARAARKGPALDTFIGQAVPGGSVRDAASGQAEELNGYATLAFLFACITGLRNSDVARIARFLRDRDKDDPETLFEAFERAAQSGSNLSRALAQLAPIDGRVVEVLRGLTPETRAIMTVSIAESLLPEARRYSFHPPTIDDVAPVKSPTGSG